MGMSYRVDGSVCIVYLQCMQFACLSILEVRFEKLPMIRNGKQGTAIFHRSFSTWNTERDFIRLLAFLVSTFWWNVSA